MEHIFGFCGLARSGKDTAGVFTKPYGYERYAFADKVREALYALNPVIGSKEGKPVYLAALVNQIGWNEAKKMPDIRKLLQHFATEVMRETVHPDIWIMAVQKDIEERERNLMHRIKVSITDLRFPNEAEWVRAQGGVVCQIVKPGVEPLRDEKGRIHKSELHVVHGDLKPDYQIVNDKGLEEFRDEVQKMIDGVGVR